MRRLAILLVLALTACQPAPAPLVVVVDSACIAQRDSLTALIDTLRARGREQRQLIRLAELQATRYAAIVARDPSQAKFLRGWMRRAFAGVVLDSNGVAR